MQTSDWTAISSMFSGILITTVGSALCLSFKIGGSSEKISPMATDIKQLDANVNELKSGFGEIRVDLAEMKVKVDEMWCDYRDRRC